MYIRSSHLKLPKIEGDVKVIPNISVNQDFFELMRRIDKVWEPYSRLGESKDKYFNKVRVQQPADMSFATREVAGLRQIIKGKENSPPLVIIENRHFGLFAPYGPMPIFVTERARNESILKRNKAFEGFMNVISQRFAIYQYRTWAQLNVAVGHDKADSNAFQNRVDQVTGVNSSKFEYYEHIRKVRRSFPGAYVSGHNSLEQLKKIISCYFGININIIKRYPIWINFENGEKFVLGSRLLGSRFRSVEYSALLELGPFYDESYLEYDRGENKLKVLTAICSDFVDHLLDFDVVLNIETDSSWRKRMSCMKIGKDSWLKPQRKIVTKLVYSHSTSKLGRWK